MENFEKKWLYNFIPPGAFQQNSVGHGGTVFAPLRTSNIFFKTRNNSNNSIQDNDFAVTGVAGYPLCLGKQKNCFQE